MDKNIKTIAIVCGVFVIAIIILSLRLFHFKSESEIWKELAEKSIKTGEQQLKTLDNSIKAAEHFEKQAKEILEQRDYALELAEIAALNVEKVQKQLKEALAEIEIYKEHIDGYIKVISWYESQLGPKNVKGTVENGR